MAALVKERREKRAARRGDGAGKRGEHLAFGVGGGTYAAGRDGAGKRVEYLAFGLGGETYAVEIRHVAEILRPPPMTGVPRAPSTVLGVISVRGQLGTVVD